MPTAESFTALGAGNGFTACAQSYNVEDFDDWITLGGFKMGDSGSPTGEQIRLSLTRAMSLFWNLYDITGSVTSQTATGTNNSIAGIMEDPFGYEINDGEPKQRTCYGVNSNRVEIYGSGGAYERATALEFSANGDIFRMLKGGEFIGYGLGILDFQGPTSWYGSPIGCGGDANSTDAYVCLSSAIIGTPSDMAYFEDQYGLSGLDQTSQHDIDYVTISDIPFACTAIGRSSGNGVATRATFLTDAASMSASASYDWPQTGRSNSTVSAQLSTLDFYTYS